PDLAPAVGLVMIYAARSASWRERLHAASLALAIAVPFLIWMRIDSGSWIPQTIEAKELFFAEACAPLTMKMGVAFQAVSAFLLMVAPLVPCAPVLVRDRLGRYGLVAIGVTLAAFVMRFPAGLSHNDSRYLYAIIVPWLSFGLACRLRQGGPF